MVLRRTTLALAVTLFLSACDNGSNPAPTGPGDNPPPPPPPSNMETGVFLDSPVAGIQYQTETQSGTTDAEGRFNYLPGETVTFSIGSITLPAVEASDTVTPLTVFATSDFTDQRVLNLGRLLQSLDDDGDLTNGIQIIDLAHSAATGLTLDFDVPTATFGSATGLNNLLANGGGSATLVSAEDALAHMQEQLADRDMSLLGTWSLEDEGYIFTVTFMANGTFILAESDAEGDSDGQPGVEYGTYQWDPLTGELAAVVTADTNEKWGFSHPRGTLYIVRDGAEGTFSESEDPDELYVLQLLEPDEENAIVGAWMVDGLDEGALSVFTFLPSGHFTVAETGTPDDAGGPGIEHGTYTWNAGTYAFASEILENTNGEWGISHDAMLSAEVSEDSISATMMGGDTVTLTRLP